MASSDSELRSGDGFPLWHNTIVAPELMACLRSLTLSDPTSWGEAMTSMGNNLGSAPSPTPLFNHPLAKPQLKEKSSMVMPKQFISPQSLSECQLLHCWTATDPITSQTLSISDWITAPVWRSRRPSHFILVNWLPSSL